MQLLIDIGNTSIKWAVRDPATPTADTDTGTDPDPDRASAPADAPAVSAARTRAGLGPMASARHHGALPIDLIAAWDDQDGIDDIVVARVGPAGVLDAVAKVAGARWQRQPRIIDTVAGAAGVVAVRIAYAEPARLGVDRFLALLGARAIDPGPAVIVDAGTAVTCDLLLGDGRHLGGLILPGIEMMRASLLAGTQIPPYRISDAPIPWADDTGAAIAAASLQAPTALAERLLARLRTEAGAEPTLIVTGGDAERLLPALTVPAVHCPDLVPLGLAALA